MQRDLACLEPWEESLQRSRQRRELAAARGPELPARELSVAAIVALTGVPVVGATVAKALGGGGGAERAGVLAPELLVEAEPAAAAAPAPEATVPAAPATPAAATSRPAPQPLTAAKPSRATTATAAVSTRPPVVTSSVRPPGGVAALQRALGVAVDGDFGRATQKALRRWQRAHGLRADGVAGSETRAALKLGDGPTLRPERAPRARRKRAGHGRGAPARPARRGGGVRALQRALGVPVDGVFGPGTERALKRWQRRQGLTPDGVAGPQTRAKLGLGSGPVLKRGRAGRRRRGGGGGSHSSTVQRVIAAANAIATKPYRYGGGHGSFTDSGYDCSGSVSYALHGGGLLKAPLDSGGFMSYGKPGPGRRITIYAHGGHVFMVIDGRRFDTSARRETGSRWSSSMRSTAGYVARHPAGL